MPAFTNPQQLTISVSLNNATNNTFSADEVPFQVYRQPTIVSVFPTYGEASGGTPVTIRGTGFTALNTNYRVRQVAMRCQFGNSMSEEETTFHNDTTIFCTTPWGVENPQGQPTCLTLNGKATVCNDAVRLGGGIKPLTFEWAVHPTGSDSYYAAQRSLKLQGSSAQTVALSSELNDGTIFLFLLKVTNFLGATSEEYELGVLRDAFPIPTISIEAPPLFEFRASSFVSLKARAKLADCFSTGTVSTSIMFRWSPLSVAYLPSASGTETLANFTFDPATRNTRDLTIDDGMGELDAGTYIIGLTVYKAVGSGAVKSSIVLTVESGALPMVSIGYLPELKQNPRQKVRLNGFAFVHAEDGNALAFNGSYTWTVTPNDVNLTDLSVASTGRSAYATMNVVMNRAPYGGSLQLKYTEPARALASTIELSADSWFDDDPADYPLSYSFSYGLASAGAGNAIDLGRRSFAKSALLIKPEAGNFILYCYVYDSFLASATSARELLVLEAAPLTAAATAALTGDVRRQLDEGNPDGGAQLIGAVASTFNAQANTTRSNMRRLSEAEGGLSTEAKAATRAALMQTVVQISGSAVNNPDPVKTKQTTMVIGSLMGAPEEQTGEAQDRGLNLLTGLLTATRARGQQMENGTAQAMLAATTG
eukprot:jgi/Chrpa1/18230/Chrysochromulina_OHIO_Genome00005840-RA